MQRTNDARDVPLALGLSLLLATGAGVLLAIAGAGGEASRVPRLPVLSVLAWCALGALPLMRRPSPRVALRDALSAAACALGMALPVTEACAHALPVRSSAASEAAWIVATDVAGVISAAVLALLLVPSLLRVPLAGIARLSRGAAWTAVAACALLAGGALTTIDRPAEAAPQGATRIGSLAAVSATQHLYGAARASSRAVIVDGAAFTTAIDLSQPGGGSCALDVALPSGEVRSFPLDAPRIDRDGATCSDLEITRDALGAIRFAAPHAGARAWTLRDFASDRLESEDASLPSARALRVPAAWLASALAGLAYAALLLGRADRTRRRLLRALGAEAATHEGDGWLHFGDGRSPVHLAAARALPRGPVLFRARAPHAPPSPYRSVDAPSGEVWATTHARVRTEMLQAVAADHALAFAAATVTAAPLVAALARGLLF